MCITCGRVMLSGGSEGYQCPMARHGKKGNVTQCSEPQRITHHAVMRLLRAEFPAALRAYAEHEGRLKSRLAQPTDTDKVRRQMEATRERMDRLYFDYYKAPDRPVAVPRAVKEDLAAMELELAALEDKAAQESEHAELTAQATDVLSKLTGANVDAQLAKLPEDKQAYLFRLIFADVCIRTDGWASGRTYELVSYRNLLTEVDTVISQCASA